MSDEVRHEMTGLLAAQVESYAEALEQRDLARDVAVQLEGELHALEIERDALIAQLHRAEALPVALARAATVNRRSSPNYSDAKFLRQVAGRLDRNMPHLGGAGVLAATARVLRVVAENLDAPKPDDAA